MPLNKSATFLESVEKLRQHGITGATIYLIDIIPLIEMIWADGRAQDSEVAILDDYLKHHVKRINRIAGYEVLTIDAANEFVSRFLEKRPDKALLSTLRSLIRSVRMSSSNPEAAAALKESLLAACLDIASSSLTEYPSGLQKRFDHNEKRCFFEILDSLKQEEK